MVVLKKLEHLIICGEVVFYNFKPFLSPVCLQSVSSQREMVREYSQLKWTITHVNKAGKVMCFVVL